MKSHSGEAGQTLIVVVLCMMIFLLGFVALATDVGALFHEKRMLQTVADSAAVAGASELVALNSAAVTSAAQADAALNGISVAADVVVNNPPLNGPHTGDATYVEAIVTYTHPAPFMSLISSAWSTMSVSARAVAHPGIGTAQGCIYTLDPSGNGITLEGTDALSVPNCSIFDDSSISMNGSTSMTAKGVGEVGTGTGNITPAPYTHMPPVPDPLAYLPAVNPASLGSCHAQASPLVPGTYYCGISGSVTLPKGIYYVGAGGLSTGGNQVMDGTAGVTIYLLNGGGVSLGGTSTMNLTAETCAAGVVVCADGTYNDVVFFQARNDSAAFSEGGNATANFNGILYFPDAAVTMHGGSAVPMNVGLVCYTLSSNGSININGLPISGGILPNMAATLAE